MVNVKKLNEEVQIFKHKFKKDIWQEEFLQTEGDKILCCGRQIGKSEICGEDGGQYAILNRKTTILMIAPTERQAQLLFNKTLDFLELNYRKYIKKGKDRPTKSKIQLKNGSLIYCLPTGLSGTGIRGLTIDRVDEASRIPEDVWIAVEPMLLTTGGDTILLSTPFGRQGYFYDVLINKEKAFNSFTRFETTSEKVIEEREICETWTEKQRERALQRLESAKARMTKNQYAQEYLGQFIDDVAQFFTDDLIKSCMTLQRKAIGLTPFPNSFFLGVDVAGQGGRDETTYEVLERINDKHFLHRENIMELNNLTTFTTRQILKLDRKYNFKNIFVDDGGVGYGVFSELLEDKQTRRKTIPINNAKRPLDKDEKRKHKILKEDLYNNLLVGMEKGYIKLLDDPEIFQSLKSVQYSYEDGRFRIFGNYTHIVEGLIRAYWGSKTKHLNISISWV
jgi:hypothetical protein